LAAEASGAGAAGVGCKGMGVVVRMILIVMHY
jgi:hypothetical protein